MNFTYSDLVQRLVDLERLADPPLPGELGGSCSSYDRRSRYNPENDTYEAWDANDDGAGFIRREEDWIIAFERAGPGVIWRVWSALPQSGHIQIWLSRWEDVSVATIGGSSSSHTSSRQFGGMSRSASALAIIPWWRLSALSRW
jgi:hypothetical protein